MRTTPSTSNHRRRQEPDARLIRGLRRGDLVALVINSVVGAGIFGLPSQVYALAGTYSLAAVVFPNIVKLGFKPADIKLMLISRAYYDHMETIPITGDYTQPVHAKGTDGRPASQNRLFGAVHQLSGRLTISG